MLGHARQADEELLKLEAGDLPGVGWSLSKQLAGLGIATVADVRASRRDLLQRELGAKTGSLVRLPNPQELAVQGCAPCNTSLQTCSKE